MAISLLAIPGFALGLLAGVAWEDPGLLALHAFGGGESVAWVAPEDPLEAADAAEQSPALPDVADAAEQSPALPDVAASAEPPPARPSATRIRPEVVTPAAPAASPAREGRPRAAKAPAPAADHFAVQVGAFAEPDAAERLAEGLRAKGFAVYVSPGAGEGAGDGRWRVRVGPLATREEAERVAGRLKVDEKLPTWVLDEDAV
jgi:DedD protein